MIDEKIISEHSGEYSTLTFVKGKIGKDEKIRIESDGQTIDVMDLSVFETILLENATNISEESKKGVEFHKKMEKILEKNKNIKEIRTEIFWLLKDFRFNNHTQIKIEDGEVTSHKKLKDTRCYVCDVLRKLEAKIAKLFGEKEYYMFDLPENEEEKDGKDNTAHKK